jgi:hypothetical protein
VGNDLWREKIMKGKVTPIDEALAGSDTDGCWVLVWNCTGWNLSE